MENLDVAIGAAESKLIKIGDTDYKLAPLGPYVVGQLIGYIKDKKRAEIAISAREMGNITISDVIALTNTELDKITMDNLDSMSNDIDVMTHMIYFSMRVHDQSLMFSDMGKILTAENISKITEVLMSDFTEKKEPVKAATA